MVLHSYFSISFVQMSWDGDVESSRHLESLTCPMHRHLFFFLSFCYVLDVINRSLSTVI
jgi:hypothetical protein